MARNWDETGLAWEVSKVARQAGDHRSDRLTINGDAQIATIGDFDTAIEHFGRETVLGWINSSNSIRVMSQEISRNGLQTGLNAEAIREKIYMRLKGMRNSPAQRTVVIEKKVYNLPNGQKYTGTDLTEYQQQYAAAMVDLGVDPEKALAVAKMQTL